MHIGFATMNNIRLTRPEVIGRALEERGFESVWLGEHAHIPVSRKTPHPAGGVMPEAYKHMADPFICLAMIAAATTKLRLATGVALLLERELFTTAKEVATLDQLCGGRLLLGVGVGWNEEELADVNGSVSRIPWKRRYSGLRDCVMALRALWTQEEAEYHGEYYQFDKAWSYPKPLQHPHPPVYVGVKGGVGTRHAAQWGDGWFPIDAGGQDFAPYVEQFRKLVSEAGRDPAKVPIMVSARGEINLDRLLRYRDLGIERVLISTARLEIDTFEKALPLLDRYGELIVKLAG